MTRGRKLGYKHKEEIRAKIQVSVLIGLLHKDALGEMDLTDGRRASIKILLAKCLPDLQAIEVSGDAENPVALKVTWQK